ncbi:MAG: glycosyltransferase [Conexivisphaerales archaeon]
MPRDIIHASVYGTGLGHAARVSLIAEKLTKEFDVYFTSWDDGARYLGKRGFRVFDVRSVDIEWNEQGRISFKGTVKRLPYFYSDFASQIMQERNIMEKLKPKLVISDSRLSAIIAAKIMNVKTMLITNQLRISLPQIDSIMMRFLERVNAEFLFTFWDQSNMLLVPDLPPPYTISEGVVDTLALSRKRLIYVGFVQENKPCTLTNSNRKKVSILVSGPPASRSSLIPMVRAAGKKLAAKYEVILSEGNAAGPSLATYDSGMKVYSWCPDPWSEIASSDVVVARAGHSTISQIILAGKRAILIPIPFHGEQWANAKKSSKLGFARVLDQLNTTPSQLVREIEYVMHDDSMLKYAEKVRDVSLRYNGIDNIVKLVKKAMD